MTYSIVTRAGHPLASAANVSDALDVLKTLPKAYRVYRSDGVAMTMPWSKNGGTEDVVVVADGVAA